MSGVMSGVSEGEKRVRAVESEVAVRAGRLNAVDGELVDLVAELHRSGGCGGLSPARWLAWRLGSSRDTAGAVAAVAARVEELAVTIGALRRGELSVDRAAVVARPRRRLPVRRPRTGLPRPPWHDGRLVRTRASPGENEDDDEDEEDGT
jgi:hypothetical protein